MNLSILLHNAALTYRDHPAITLGDELRLTYGQLSNRVARLAAGLRDLPGVVPGDRIALVMSNRVEYIELLFAIWHAGLCAVPVNAKLHAKEVEFILENSGVGYCFVTSDRAQDIAPLQARSAALQRVICVDDADYAGLLANDGMAMAITTPTGLAWVFYTSGTTGRPKGAMLSHRNLMGMAIAYISDIDYLSADDGLVHLGPQSHAGGLFCLSHIAKGSHQIMPASGGYDAGELIDIVSRYSNLSFFLAPVMLRRFLEHPQIGSLREENVKTILCGAAPVYVEDVKRTFEVFGPKLWNGYGQGEAPCTITALPKEIMADVNNPRWAERIASVGIARSGVDVRIFDENDREVPAGEIGEIVTSSDVVMQGYWNNEAASAAALKGGWLHTGDLGAIDAEGFLRLMDRSKDLIISGGSNIYPREIEEIILTHPSVEEVAVVGKPDAEWGEQVVAFVVVGDGQDIEQSQADLDQLCLDNVARFKRPKRYLFVDELPKNNYGKVLKTELRAQLTLDNS